MSTLPENELNLEKLFLPAWAQEDPSSTKYAKYELPDERWERRGDRRGPRPPRREGPPGPRRDDSRPGGERRGPRREGGRGPGGRQQGPPGQDRREHREPPAPLPEVNIALVPEDRGVESLARQIRVTGRAYPLFDIAQMILQKPDRVNVVFSIKKNPQGEPVQPLFVCALDDSLWLSEEEAIAHVLKKHFGTFYQVEKTPSEPPKGKYTFVAQCGMSGQILGPPNYHDYQNQLRKLHAERYSRMPFEAYKSRVKIVRDEEVVKKWVEDQSFKTDYICLNMPEPLRLGSMEAVERHFRETHREAIIKQVDSHTVQGTEARSLRSPELARLVRSVWDDQRRFPLQIATALSQQFAGHGLQFFKVNKTVTHVSVARPHYLDLEAAPVSEGIKRIVEFINATPKCTRKRLVESLAPTPTPATPAAPAAPVTTTDGTSPEVQAQPPAPSVDPGQPTPEQTAVIADLHWLIHQGHVIEFANGILETAKKPLPKPPKPEPKPQKKPAEQAVTPETGSAPVESAPPPSAAPEEAAPEPTGTPEAQAAPSESSAQPEPTPAASAEVAQPAEPAAAQPEPTAPDIQPAGSDTPAEPEPPRQPTDS